MNLPRHRGVNLETADAVIRHFASRELSAAYPHAIPGGTRRLNVLLLCDDGHPANVVQDHIRAFTENSRHHVKVINPSVWRTPDFPLGLFDVLIIHYSVCILWGDLLPESYYEPIRRFGGLKLQLIQDEYRWIPMINEQMAHLGIHLLFSAMRPENIERVYTHSSLRQIPRFGTLSGYVPRRLIEQPVPPIRQRRLHVTYRTRDVPFWLGKLGRQKKSIAVGFGAVANRHGLLCDISNEENARFYGASWNAFLTSGKAMLATEGGASVFDLDGKVEARCKEYLVNHPEAGFEEVHDAILREYEGNLVHAALTPRIFEAIALRTALVLFRGDYAGVLKPWRHYVPLEQDFSNGDRVAELLKDDHFLQEMADRAYQEVALDPEYAFSTFIQRIDCALEDHWRSRVGASRQLVRALAGPLGILRSFSVRAYFAFRWVKAVWSRFPRSINGRAQP